jgi:hypothetical protein
MGIGIVTGPDLKAYSVAVLQERFGKARFEDALGGLAEFEIRRGQQALLLVLVKKAVRRYQLEYLASCRIPAVRPAPARNSSSVSDKVPRSPAAAPAIRNCFAVVVLPLPGLPSSRNTASFETSAKNVVPSRRCSFAPAPRRCPTNSHRFSGREAY